MKLIEPWKARWCLVAFFCALGVACSSLPLGFSGIVSAPIAIVLFALGVVTMVCGGLPLLVSTDHWVRFTFTFFYGAVHLFWIALTMIVFERLQSKGVSTDIYILMVFGLVLVLPTARLYLRQYKKEFYRHQPV